MNQEEIKNQKTVADSHSANLETSLGLVVLVLFIGSILLSAILIPPAEIALKGNSSCLFDTQMKNITNQCRMLDFNNSLQLDATLLNIDPLSSYILIEAGLQLAAGQRITSGKFIRSHFQNESCFINQRHVKECQGSSGC